jgi:hypothetical protein
MDPDKEDHSSWKRARFEDMSGMEILQAVREGLLWINVAEAGSFDARYQEDHRHDAGAAGDESAGAEDLPARLGILISSPNARVFYHCDIPGQGLMHVRGEKTIWIYPDGDPFLPQEALERVVTGLSYRGDRLRSGLRGARHDDPATARNGRVVAAELAAPRGQWRQPQRVMHGRILDRRNPATLSGQSGQWRVTPLARHQAAVASHHRPRFLDEGGLWPPAGNCRAPRSFSRQDQARFRHQWRRLKKPQAQPFREAAE